MKRVVVTGANGFIGTELCKEFNRRNIQIIAILRREQSYTDELKNCSMVSPVYCPMENLEVLPELITERGFDAFIHLAWGGVTGNERGNTVIQTNNIKWSLDTVKIANQIECRRFVGVGTLAETDVLNYSLFDESTPNLVSCYGAAKVASHMMTKAVCNDIGLDHLWAYLPNSYGTYDKSSNFINFAINSICSEKPDFTPGEQLYDFVDVRDVVNGIYAIADKGIMNKSYYIGSGSPRKLKEYIIAIRDLINPSLKLNLGAVPFHGKSADPETFSCEKINTDTGFEAKIPFEDGIRNLLEKRGLISEQS